MCNENENDIADAQKKGVERKRGQMALKKPRGADNMQTTVLKSSSVTKSQNILAVHRDQHEIRMRSHSLNMIFLTLIYYKHHSYAFDMSDWFVHCNTYCKSSN